MPGWRITILILLKHKSVQILPKREAPGMPLKAQVPLLVGKNY